MLDEHNKLKVMPYLSSVFSDVTNQAWDYSRDFFGLVMAAADYLYLGRYKPFNTLYIEMDAVANSNAATLSAEYWNGTAWVALAFDVEDTNAFARSGFIKWQSPTDWAADTVNSLSKFFMRFKTSADFSAGTSVCGINLVFSDDQDLKARRFDIADYLPENQAGVTARSFILAHVAAREQILQRFSIDSRLKQSANDIPKNIDQWDLFETNQVRNASIYMALSYIFENLSDAKDDKYDMESKKYLALSDKAMQISLLAIDSDDDGKESNQEGSQEAATITLRR